MVEKYPLAIRLTHWLMAILIICLLTVGLIMTNIPRENPWHNTLYSLHKSVGVTVLLLLILRVFLRLSLGTPALPEVIPPAERKLAYSGHFLFYLFMIAMPLSGFLMSNAFGFSVNFFGLVDLPKLMDVNKPLGGLLDKVHEYGGYTLIGLIVLHVAGLILHRFKERVNLLQRMV